MTTGESAPFDEQSDAPHLAPDVLHAWLEQYPRDIEQQLTNMRSDNPELARIVFVASDIYGNGRMQQKRAFTAGALYMYGLIKFNHQVEKLEQIPTMPPSNDTDGDTSEQSQD